MKLITSLAFIEVIYELGSQSAEIKTTSVFNESPATYTELTHYYLLVLIPKGENLQLHEVQDKIENSCRSIVSVTALVMFLEDFKKLASDGHRFANTVCNKSSVVFTKCPDMPAAAKESILPTENGEIWTKEYNQVNELIKGVDFYHNRKQVGMALFMAHQAAITLLHYLFKKTTGLSLQTQNFDKLIRYCSLLNGEIPFSKTTDADKRFYELLRYLRTHHNKKRHKPNRTDIDTLLHWLQHLRLLLHF